MVSIKAMIVSAMWQCGLSQTSPCAVGSTVCEAEHVSLLQTQVRSARAARSKTASADFGFDWDEPPIQQHHALRIPPALIEEEAKPQEQKEGRSTKRQGKSDDEVAPEVDPLLNEIMSYDWDRFEDEAVTKPKGKTDGHGAGWETNWEKRYETTLQNGGGPKVEEQTKAQKLALQKRADEQEAARRRDIEKRLRSEADDLKEDEIQADVRESTDAKTDTQTEAKSQVKSEVISDINPEVKSVEQSEAQSEPQSDTKREIGREEETEANAPSMPGVHGENERLDENRFEKIEETGNHQTDHVPEGSVKNQSETNGQRKPEFDEWEDERRFVNAEESGVEVVEAKEANSVVSTAVDAKADGKSAIDHVELVHGYVLHKRRRCGVCGDSNNLRLGEMGESFDAATRHNAVKVCGPICAEHPECGGFNFVESLGNCYYRKVTSCQSADDEDRDCYERSQSGQSTSHASREQVLRAIDGEAGSDVLGPTGSAAVAQQFDGLAKELDQMRDALATFETRPASAAGPLPALGFAKTHRTGSSTIVNILQRLGYDQNLTFMLPSGREDQGGLGWPGPFPGAAAAALNGAPEHQMDIICNSVVFNEHEMRSYLRPMPLLFSVLRRPSLQAMSAFSEYNPTSATSWGERLAWLESLWLQEGDEQLGKDATTLRARFQNPQAHDLGWYEQVGNTPVFDQDDAAIGAWIGRLGRSLDMVLITEHFDEGLVLLGKRLGLNTQDLAYVLKSRGKLAILDKEVPTAREAAKIEELLHVDTALYNHFNKTFWKSWETAGGYAALSEELFELRRLNAKLEEKCGAGAKHSAACPWMHNVDAAEFTARIKKRRLPEGVAPGGI